MTLFWWFLRLFHIAVCLTSDGSIGAGFLAKLALKCAKQTDFFVTRKFTAQHFLSTSNNFIVSVGSL